MDSAVITLTFPFKCTSFELAQLSLTVPKPVHLFCVYRPPPSKQNKSAHTIFLHELADFLEHCNLLAGKVLIAGVLHVHFDRPADHVTARVVCPMSPPTDADMDPLYQRGGPNFSVVLCVPQSVFGPCWYAVLPGRRKAASSSCVPDHQESKQHRPDPFLLWCCCLCQQPSARCGWRVGLAATVCTWRPRRATVREVIQCQASHRYSSVAPEPRSLRQERRRAERRWLASWLTAQERIRDC